MPRFFIGIDANKVGDVHTDDRTGELVKVTMYPVASNPDNIPAGNFGLQTEWVVTHPTQPLLLAFTSYWNRHPANLVGFKIANGSLEKVFECSTGGREACHAMLYPNYKGKDTITLAVAHHNDGMITFFQFPTQSIPQQSELDKQSQPTMTIELPEIVPGTRRTPGTAKMELAMPCAHHVYYAPNGKFLLVVDPQQNTIMTYPVDDTGLPTQPEASSTFTCKATKAKHLGWFSQVFGKILGLSARRPRRVAISPNGQHVFVSFEWQNAIQVYQIDPDTGTVDPNGKGCMQEISTLDDSLTSSKLIGLTAQGSAELTVYENALYVSNRGEKAGARLGKSENSVRIYDIKDGGRLVFRQVVTCPGPVRHFTLLGVPGDGDALDTLLIAGTTHPATVLRTFRRKGGDAANSFELVGQADVGANVLCVVENNHI